jgi:hypothetical protein
MQEAILMVREAPLHLGHSKLMSAAAKIGAIIIRPCGLYHRPRTLDDMVNHTVDRILDHLDVRRALHGDQRDVSNYLINLNKYAFPRLILSPGTGNDRLSHRLCPSGESKLIQYAYDISCLIFLFRYLETPFSFGEHCVCFQTKEK